MNIYIGDYQSESFKIDIEGKLYPNAADYWDGNYLKALILFEIPGFSGRFHTNIRTFELGSFLSDLNNINTNLKGECVLSNVDETINVIGKINDLGSMTWHYTLIYPSGDGTIIKFRFTTSFSVINDLTKSIKSILSEWPIIGNPD
ncbi:MAG: hypothetical protein JKY70_14065 [Mucilaginibacter sp.]|nr:hypothetical protein [Mucilaginibacter sp.]